MAKRSFTSDNQIHGRDVEVVFRTPVDCPQVDGLSRIESELVYLFGRCHSLGKNELIGYARMLSELNKSISDDNVIDFQRYREERHV